MNVQVLGISVDHIPCLQAWAKELGEISFPLLSDFWPHGKIAKKYGVLRDDGVTERAIFIIDEKGVIRYIDIHDIDQQPSNEVLMSEIQKISPVKTPVLFSEDGFELPQDGLVVYCNNWCPDCRKARNWLKENEIEYKEINVEGSPKAAKKVREWANGNLTTPTFYYKGTVIVDFDVKKLEELLLKS